ncbi:ATP-grasp domain-containing protein [Actinacidiphila soli]|uniref:ATP-grasp domain-containing protein n=1 Tax=Actinacidiphila soli TaxID=2487275 RepID=UPI000FCBCC1E|nr:siderophore biosynthesis protein [Actinacidiphila soli]
MPRRRLYALAQNPTDSVTEGFLPAADLLGLEVTVLTGPGHAAAHRRAYAGLPGVEVLACEVRDFREVIGRISRHHAPDAVFSNSDHLQTQTALAAEYFGLPAKDWKAALRTKNKAQMRRHLAATGADTVRSAELGPDQDPATLLGQDLPWPLVVKPREGVASEDVLLATGPEELLRYCARIRARRPGTALVAEEFLAGELYTLETLGDGSTLHVLGGFHTWLSVPPHFIEERLDFVPAHDPAVVDELLTQLKALGVGFGACHTEFILQTDGRPRLVEVNYRAIGDQCDLLLAGLLGILYFETVLRTHLGEPLPADLGARTDARARLDYPCADRAGTLTAAPGAQELTVDGVRLTYRPLRSIGERHEVYGTNRDFLGVVRATGTEQETVNRAVADFIAAQRWEITP